MSMVRFCKYCGKELSKHYYNGYDYEQICDCEDFYIEKENYGRIFELKNQLKKAKNENYKHIFESQVGVELLSLLNKKHEIENRIEIIKKDYGITDKQIEQYRGNYEY